MSAIAGETPLPFLFIELPCGYTNQERVLLAEAPGNSIIFNGALRAPLVGAHRALWMGRLRRLRFSDIIRRWLGILPVLEVGEK